MCVVQIQAYVMHLSVHTNMYGLARVCVGGWMGVRTGCLIQSGGEVRRHG